jgi:diguanylate cyclase (GGDEF)-like protein
VGPSVAIAVAGTLALSYNRSRVFLVCCLLAFMLWLKGQSAEAGFEELIITGLSAFNILIICYYRERGTFTLIGVVRLVLLVGQFVAVIVWLGKPGTLSPNLLDPFTLPDADWVPALPLHQINLILVGISFLGCVVRLAFDRTPITQGLTTAMLGVIIAYTIPGQFSWEIFLMASSLFLCASIIRDSYNMAYRDELTGLPHRRALNEQFLSLGGRYSLAMLDVDHFKKFNDTHGHDIGDQVLQMVAAKIDQVGGGGRSFRYGGEEFSVVFPRMKKEDALYHLDEIRKAIQNYEMVVRKEPREETTRDKSERKKRQRGSFRTASEKVSVTISIGVAERGPDLPTPDDVLKAADQALYAAKKGGRNQVAVAP